MSKTITFEDFSKIDLRIGTIIEVNDFLKAHKPAYQLTIDFGDLGDGLQYRQGLWQQWQLAPQPLRPQG